MGANQKPTGVEIAITALRGQRVEEMKRREESDKSLRQIDDALRILGAPDEAAAERPTKRTRRPRVKRVAPRLKQVAAVLREAGRTMTAKEIGDAMHVKDPSVNWQQPGNVLRSLTRDQMEGPDKILRPGTGLYTLQEALHATAASAVESRLAQPPASESHFDRIKAILAEAGGDLHYSEIHRRMCQRVPGLRWNHPAESVRQIANRSKGVIIGTGKGMWRLADTAAETSG